jgi:NAD(P)H-quinone oxidoreductase subunit 5
MSHLLSWLPFIGPLGLAALGLLPPGRGPADPPRRAARAAAASLLTVAAAMLAFALRPPVGGGAPDALGATMLTLVAFVGAVVLRYSRNYLAGDPRQDRFVRLLSLTLAAILVMVLSSNLLLTGLAWLATGVGLRRLLTFYAARQAARLAARKNLIVSRAADLCLLAACAILYARAGSLDYADLRAMAEPAPAAALLIAAAALLKSAQVPVHGWLLEVMETPTPVSALLHAGIINGGGFVLLRMAGVLDGAPAALALLAIVGAVTAILGSLVMLTQTSVKVSLAYSTVAQMGFMMLEIGLGAYAAAVLHMVAHALYKAHAFLSAGSVVDLARAAWSPRPGERPHPARFALALVAALAIALVVGHAFGAGIVQAPGVAVLGAVLVMGLTQLLAQGLDARPSRVVVGRTVLLALAVAIAYHALQAASERLFAGTLPLHAPTSGLLDVVLAAFVIAAFAGLTVFQIVAVGHVDGPFWRALHAHVANGFYLNTVVNRWLLQRPRGERRA